MKIEALVDTGASLSLLPIHAAPGGPAGHTRIQGVEGKVARLEQTKPLLTKIGNTHLMHQFVCSPACPVALLGRDILTKLQAEVSFSREGWMEVQIPKQQGSNYCMALLQSDTEAPPLKSGKPFPE